MNATDAKGWSQWLRYEGSSWLFVLRTVLGILMAVGIALRLDLGSPGSAAVTVSIIALPQTGMVLEKSFYRLLGTLLGAVVALALLASLVQHRDTFIVAVAVWIGICTAASTWFRGFQAYGWLLSGYTTCLIGFPAVMDADNAFDIAVDRVTIVGVGILCAGVVNAAILPSRSSTTLVQLVRGSFRDFVAFIETSTRPGGASELGRTQHRVSRDLAALEAARTSSRFEDPGMRIRSGRLMAFIDRIMFASSRLHLVHRMLDTLRSRGANDVLRVLEPRLAAFRDAVRIAGAAPANAAQAEPVATRLESLLHHWSELEDEPPAACSDSAAREALLGARLLLEEAVAETYALTAVYADMHSPRGRGHWMGRENWTPGMRSMMHREMRSSWRPGTLRATRRRFFTDARQAVLSGVRAALVVLVTCAFWIASAWPEGFSMTLLGVVGCALFSATPNPGRSALLMCKGFVLGLPALVVCYSLVLPAASDFPMLALGLLPFLALGAWLMTRPAQVLVGSGYFLMFLTGLNLSGVMSYDFIGMFNNAVALMVGIAVATLSLAVIVPPDLSWGPDRARVLLLRCLRMARDEPLDGLPLRYESQVRDLTLQLIALRVPGTAPDADEDLGLAILEAGDAIIRIRRSVEDRIDDRMGETRVDVRVFLDRLVAAVESRDPAALRVLCESPATSDMPLQFTVALGLLRLTLDDMAALFDVVESPNPSHASTPGTTDVA